MEQGQRTDEFSGQPQGGQGANILSPGPLRRAAGQVLGAATPGQDAAPGGSGGRFRPLFPRLTGAAPPGTTAKGSARPLPARLQRGAPELRRRGFCGGHVGGRPVPPRRRGARPRGSGWGGARCRRPRGGPRRAAVGVGGGGGRPGGERRSRGAAGEGRAWSSPPGAPSRGRHGREV